MNFFKPIFIVLVFFSQFSYAYVLRNEFYILNLCQSTVEINYNTCIFKVTNGKPVTSCEDDVLILKPKEAKKFSVDSDDNYVTDANNYFYRELFVYQVVSDKALGLFIKDKADLAKFKEDYTNVPVKGSVNDCIASKEGSVILKDYGTDTIYCE